MRIKYEDLTSRELGLFLAGASTGAEFGMVSVPSDLVEALLCRLVPELDYADLENKVKFAYENRGKIQAIKLYRERTGCGLKDAKESVEELASANGWLTPARTF